MHELPFLTCQSLKLIFVKNIIQVHERWLVSRNSHWFQTQHRKHVEDILGMCGGVCVIAHLICLYWFIQPIHYIQVAVRSTSPNMTIGFHTRLDSRFIEGISLRKKKFHRLNKGSFFMRQFQPQRQCKSPCSSQKRKGSPSIVKADV